MTEFLFLVPISIGMGLVGLIAFLWALGSDQYEDLEGAAARIVDDQDYPLNPDIPPASKEKGLVTESGENQYRIFDSMSAELATTERGAGTADVSASTCARPDTPGPTVPDRAQR